VARQEFDKSSKYMVQKQAGGILFLGGARDVVRYSAKQAELVQPRRLPDGLLEVYFRGRDEPDHVLVEIATYPEKRVAEQVTDDVMLTYQHFRKLPEVLTLVLHPRGQVEVTGRHEVQSRLGWASFGCTWKVVELWKVPAEELLAANDVGLIPWVPLTKFDSPPEAILTQCRQRIEQQAHPDDQANLLAVSQVLAQLRFANPDFIALLGGKKAMIESPLIEEIMAETRQETILDVLRGRFGEPSVEVTTLLRAVRKSDKLSELAKYAGACPDLEAFRNRLLS